MGPHPHPTLPALLANLPRQLQDPQTPSCVMAIPPMCCL